MALGGAMRGWVWFVVWPVACQPVGPTSLRDVDFPPGFALDTARVAVVRFEASPGVDVDGSTVHLATAAGDAVFDGPAAYAVAHDLEVRLPPGTDALTLTVEAARTTRTTTVRLHGPRTVVSLW